MYQIEVTPFGDFEKFTFSQLETGHRFSLVPQFGACVLEVCFAGQSVLDGYQTPEAMQRNKWGKNVLLYPFPNRLRNGRYTWQGQNYQFPINDPDTGNALHGIGMDKPMGVEEIDFSKDFAEITCLYSSRGEAPGYPFPFTFAVTFRLENTPEFTVEMVFQNDGDAPIPVGFGWHPYFQLAYTIDALYLQIPPCEQIETDERLLPTSRRRLFDAFAQGALLDATVLDNCFALQSNRGRAELLLRGAKGDLCYWQETGPSKFNFLQLFTPPHRRSLAVEPMTCNIDAFNNGDGLIVLNPQSSTYARAGFSLITMA